jgi:hypothetical protein
MCRSASGVVRTGLATASCPKSLDDGVGWRRATLVGLLEAARDGCVQSFAFAIVELVALVVEDEIHNSPFRKVGREIKDQAAVAYRCANAHLQKILGWLVAGNLCAALRRAA